MGYWTGAGPAVHVRPRDQVPDRRPLVLQRARPDRPEPPLPDRRHLERDDRRHRRVARQLRPRRVAAGAGQRHDLRSADRRRDQLDRLQLELPRRARRWSCTRPTTPPSAETNAKPIAQFFTDAQAGTLPSFSLLDPNYDTQSQENPQNIVVGEAFLSQVVQALGQLAARGASTLLILTYDEHGGYYDHVPPPAALAPDAIPPMVQPGESTYDGFHRYGFRVPVGRSSARTSSATT